MLAAATVNGFQFSLLVFSLEHDSPITQALLADTRAWGSFFKRQPSGTASSGPGDQLWEIMKVWVQCWWLGLWVFLKYMNTIFFLFFFFFLSLLSKNVEEFSQKLEPRTFSVIRKWKIADIFHLKEQQ